MKLSIAEALWNLNLLPVESLADVAGDALMEGFDSPALCQLAGYQPGDPLQPAKLFEEALLELNRPPFSRDEAVRRVALDYCEKILSGECTPYEGAKRIWWDLWDKNRHLGELTLFAGLASEYQDEPAYRQQCNDAIIQAAEAVVKNGSRP